MIVDGVKPYGAVNVAGPFQPIEKRGSRSGGQVHVGDDLLEAGRRRARDDAMQVGEPLGMV